MCRASNNKFLKTWSHWYNQYDNEFTDEDTDEDDVPMTPGQLLHALRQIEEIEASESRENERRLQELDFPLINPGESLSEFHERIERENPQ